MNPAPIPPGEGKAHLLPSTEVQLDLATEHLPGSRCPDLRHFIATGEVKDFHLQANPEAYRDTYPQAYQGEGTVPLNFAPFGAHQLDKDNP